MLLLLRQTKSSLSPEKLLSVAGEDEKIRFFSLPVLPFGALREFKIVERRRLHGDAVARLRRQLIATIAHDDWIDEMFVNVIPFPVKPGTSVSIVTYGHE